MILGGYEMGVMGDSQKNSSTSRKEELREELAKLEAEEWKTISTNFASVGEYILEHLRVASTKSDSNDVPFPDSVNMDKLAKLITTAMNNGSTIEHRFKFGFVIV